MMTSSRLQREHPHKIHIRAIWVIVPIAGLNLEICLSFPASPPGNRCSQGFEKHPNPSPEHRAPHPPWQQCWRLKAICAEGSNYYTTISTIRVMTKTSHMVCVQVLFAAHRFSFSSLLCSWWFGAACKTCACSWYLPFIWAHAAQEVAKDHSSCLPCKLKVMEKLSSQTSI